MARSFSMELAGSLLEAIRNFRELERASQKMSGMGERTKEKGSSEEE